MTSLRRSFGVLINSSHTHLIPNKDVHSSRQMYSGSYSLLLLMVVGIEATCGASSILFCFFSKCFSPANARSQNSRSACRQKRKACIYFLYHNHSYDLALPRIRAGGDIQQPRYRPRLLGISCPRCL